jgi:methylated-DNA-protein-cysteine methyltransferase related protein
MNMLFSTRRKKAPSASAFCYTLYMKVKRFGANNSFLDLTFSERVVYLAQKIPPGSVSTYGDIAQAAGGGAMAAQSITAILGKAYDKGIKNIPFHRIVYADGRVWFDARYEKERRALYKKEKVELDERGRVKDFASRRFDFHSVTY